MVLSLYEDESTHGSVASLDKELFDQDSVKDNHEKEESKKVTRSKSFDNRYAVLSIETKQIKNHIIFKGNVIYKVIFTKLTVCKKR